MVYQFSFDRLHQDQSKGFSGSPSRAKAWKKKFKLRSPDRYGSKRLHFRATTVFLSPYESVEV